MKSSSTGCRAPSRRSTYHASRRDAHLRVTARLLDAILGQRVIRLQYHSLESRREKLYTVIRYV